MSGTHSASSSSSSSSSSTGMKPTVVLMGDTAQQHVFKLMTFIVNKSRHHVSTKTMAMIGTSSAAKGLKPLQIRSAKGDAIRAADTGRDSWNAEAGTLAADPTKSFAPGSFFLSACQHALSRPPQSGACGEMALLAYQKIISLAIMADFPMAVAAVQIVGGNHAFVLVGPDAQFTRALTAGPTHLAVPVAQLPWGPNVYICDPWIDDGRCGTFRANELVGSGSAGETAWKRYLGRVAVQAGGAAVTAALAVASNQGQLTLSVDDSIVISSTTSETETDASATAPAPVASKPKPAS